MSGEIRTVQKGQERIKEAAKLGFEKIVVPKANAPREGIKDVEVIKATDLSQVVSYCFS